LLVDGSITANKITTNTLSAITANMGTVNGGTFKTHTLDANGNVTHPTEFRAEISNVGDWPLWIGSGSKTANNAVVWIDRQGNAAFKGKVNAGNVVGQFQSATAINWSGALSTGTEYQTVHTFTLPAPLVVGNSHIPVLSVTLRMTEPVEGLQIVLEQQVASVWQVLAEWEGAHVHAYTSLDGAAFVPGTSHSHSFMAGGQYGNTSTASTPAVQIPPHTHAVTLRMANSVATLAASGIPTGSASSYRVRVKTSKPGTVRSVSGFIFGIR